MVHRDFLRPHHYSQSMPPFDYNAPAELFLAKRPRIAARNTGALRQRLRPSATPSRTCGHPKPSALGWRSGMHASTAAKSSVCMKPRLSVAQV